MDSWISIAGSVASIFGALWAVHEARRARKSADLAERMRSEIVDRRKLVEVSQVYSETRRILSVVSLIGPACTRDNLKGIDCAGIAHEVGEYVNELLHQSEHFADDLQNKVVDLTRDLRLDIEALAAATTFKKKSEIGKSIYYKVQGFLPIVKRMSDAKREEASRF